MPVVHIVSVGTSILGNTLKLKNNPEIMPEEVRENVLNVIEKYELWKFSRARPGSSLDEDAGKHAYKGSPVFNTLLELVEWNPKFMSAELNALLCFSETYSRLKPDEIYLYHTDTGAGKLCSQIIYYYLKKRGFKVYEPIRVEEFGISFNRGLINLLNKVGRIIYSKKTQGHRVYLNVTAGYKAENAFLTLAGWLLGADGAYYMHESFNNPTLIPAIPVTVKEEYLNIARELRELGTTPKYILEQKYSKILLEDLEYKGIIEIKNEKVKLRDWVKALLKLISPQH